VIQRLSADTGLLPQITLNQTILRRN